MTIQTIYRPVRLALPSPREVAIGGAKLIIDGGLGLLKWWRAYVRHQREREAWDRFDDHLLRDIGLHRGDVVWLDGVTITSRCRAVETGSAVTASQIAP
jgi:exoribonuclease II